MNPCTNAGDTEEGLIPGSGRSPEEGVETHSSFLAWRIPRTEEPGGPQSYELQSGTTVGTACMQGVYAGFLGGSDGEESACSAGDTALIPGSGRSSRVGNGNPLQCSCLENPVDRRAWWATAHRVTESWTD